MKILIFVFSSQKGLLYGLGEVLAKNGHKITFLFESKHAFNQAKKLNLKAKNLLLEQLVKKAKKSKEKNRFLYLEKTYGESLSFIVSQERGLGQGYLFNAQGHPFVIKSKWDQKQKYAKIAENFKKYEAAADKIHPHLVLGVGLPNVAYLVFRKKRIPVRILTTPRFGSLYRWTENEAEESKRAEACLQNNLLKARQIKTIPDTPLLQSTFAKYFFQKHRFELKRALPLAIRQIVQETYQLACGKHKQGKGGYKYLGWVFPILRRPIAYKYCERYGKQPNQIDKNLIVFFPLHMEPEATLFNLSPKQNNSMELIAWVSKTLPANCTLVVKEHPEAFGIRPIRFYDNMSRMANVVMAHPKIETKEWISSCSFVANIASTVAFEAVALEKPVLSFGAHQLINFLPTVQYADSFLKTQRAVQILLKKNCKTKRLLKESRLALHLTMQEVGFDLSGYEKNFKSESPHPEMAEKALRGLAKEFPDLLI